MDRGDGEKITYFEIVEDGIWKVKMIKEIIDLKNYLIKVEDYEGEVLEVILKQGFWNFIVPILSGCTRP